MKILALFVAIWALGGGLHAEGPPTGRIVTTTRLVALFSELETECLGALQHHDDAVLDRLVDEDFQVWTPRGDPLPREDWLRTSFATPLRSFRLGHMAVRDLGGTAIVSFVQHRDSGAATTDEFVVDVWAKQAGGWRLTDRYAAQVPPAREDEVHPRPRS